jgi:hypothetical protein
MKTCNSRGKNFRADKSFLAFLDRARQRHHAACQPSPDKRRYRQVDFPSFRLRVPAQVVDATLARSLLAGVSNPNVFLGR